MPSSLFIDRSLCFVAGEDADAPDVAAMARFGHADGYQVAVFDGRTGQRRWASERRWAESFNLRGDVRCPAPDVVFAWGTDRTVELHAARTGAVLWQARTEETPSSVGFGPGCASVGLIDGTTFDADLTTGARRACVPSSPRTSRAIETTDEKAVTLRLAESTVTMTAKPKGTPTLTIRSTGARAWERKLEVTGLGHSAKLWVQAHDGIVVLAGGDPVDESALSLVGLDAATGEVRYTRALGKANNGWLPFFRVEGRYLFTFLHGLRAIDPATGEQVWEASE